MSHSLQGVVGKSWWPSHVSQQISVAKILLFLNPMGEFEDFINTQTTKDQVLSIL